MLKFSCLIRAIIGKELLTDKCSINFVELVKIDSEIDKNNRRKLWLQLIKSETKEELDMLEQTGVPDIQKAVVILHKMSADEKVQEMARQREKQLLDETSALRYAEKKGKKEGEAIGIKKGEAIGIKKGEAIGIKKGEAIGIKKGEAKVEKIIDQLRKSGMSEEQIQKILNS